MKAANTNLVSVISSSISHVGFNVAESALIVAFKGGSEYKYHNVPEALFLQMMAPARTEDAAGNVEYIKRSVGRFLNAQVKGKYTYEKLTA